MDTEYLRELAEEGAGLHSENQPEREVCDGLLWALAEIERLHADHKRMNAIDEPGRRWTFWIGKSAPHQLITMAVQPYDSLRDVIDRFYGLRA